MSIQHIFDKKKPKKKKKHGFKLKPLSGSSMDVATFKEVVISKKDR